MYFVTQNPLDIPDTVLAQLGNRVQHALRAYTPRDQKAVKSAAETFRPNPKLKTAQVITELGVGEALVSFLEDKGVPSIVERILIRPPSARVGPVNPAERKAIIDKSPVRGQYDTLIDRESAYEKLQKKTTDKMADEQQGQEEASSGGGIGDFIGSIFGTNRKRGERLTTSQTIAREVTRTVTGRVAGQIAPTSAGASVGRLADPLAGRSCVVPSVAFCAANNQRRSRNNVIGWRQAIASEPDFGTLLLTKT